MSIHYNFYRLSWLRVVARDTHNLFHVGGRVVQLIESTRYGTTFFD